MERFTVEDIELKDLDWEFPAGSRYAYADEALADSMARRGLINPILVSGSRPRVVIDGHRRAVAAKALGWGKIACVQSSAVQSPEEAFYAALTARWSPAWPDEDRLVVLSRAEKKFKMPRDKLCGLVLPLLGLRPQEAVLDIYLEVSRMHPDILENIAGRVISVRIAWGLRRFHADDQRLLCRNFSELFHMSMSQQQYCLDTLADWQRSREAKLEAFWNIKEVDAILRHPIWDKHQKGRALFCHLKTIRNPRLAAQETRFYSAAQQISENCAGIEIEAPEYFEDAGYVMKVKLKKPASVDILEQLLRDKKDSLKSLFDIIL
ncbi:MAG: hypothetical protein A2Z83_07290 [Omnitrophica bacterium GWA2_52_8]|nr:MAG: hypothetical protein A2Z83_07290 [Omnitrophica bacterium GWA2_52_8]